MAFFRRYCELSVTRLGDFWNSLVTNCITKVTQMFGDFLGSFEKHCKKVKLVRLLLGQLLETLGLLFITTSGHTDCDRHNIVLQLVVVVENGLEHFLVFFISLVPANSFCNQESCPKKYNKDLFKAGALVYSLWEEAHVHKVRCSSPSTVYLMDHLSHLFVVKIVLFYGNTENKQKEAEDGPFKKYNKGFKEDLLIIHFAKKFRLTLPVDTLETTSLTVI